jgi:hypothetical protein
MSMSEQGTVKQEERVWARLAHGSILLASLGIR